MENVSPIVYKRLSFEKFEKTGYIDTGSTVMYDKHSNNLVQFSDDHTRIFNKKATRIKKNLNLRLTKDKINAVAVDKRIRYMIALVDNKMILVINLTTEKVCEMLHYDFKPLLGLFFLNGLDKEANPDEYVFSMVFKDKLVFFRILADKVFEHKALKFVDNTVLSYLFNMRHSVLVLERSDKNFDLFNLSSEKHLTKAHKFIYPYKTSKFEGRSSITNFFGMFRKSIKKDPESPLLDNKQRKEMEFKKSQFYLEILYNKLLFICINYDEEEIQIFLVESLIDVRKVKTILFKNSQVSTLQFIDNLIVLHNFERCDSMVIDMKSESQDKVIFRNYPMTNYDSILNNKSEKTILKQETSEEDKSSQHSEVKDIEKNKNIYEKDITVLGCLIKESEGGSVYLVYFDPQIYYETSSTKYEAVFNLIRRQNAREVIIQALFKMIESNFSFKVMKVIFNKIVKTLQKNSYKPGDEVLMLTAGESDDNVRKQSYALSAPEKFILLKQKSNLKQSDIYYGLFKPSLYESVNSDNLFNLLIIFVDQLLSNRIPVHPSFQTVLIEIMKSVHNFSLVLICLQYHSLPDCESLAEFLIWEYNDNNLLQTGLDMLIRMRKYDLAFSTLVRKNMLVEALNFIKRYKVKIECLDTQTNLELKRIALENPNLIQNFISS